MARFGFLGVGLLMVVFGIAPSVEADSLRLLATVGGNNSVISFDAATGNFAGVFVPANRGGLDIPQTLTLGPDGNVYVASWNNGSIKRYKFGNFIDSFVPSGSGGLANPDQVVFGPDGNLYVSDRFSATIKRYDGATGAFLSNFVSDSRLEGFIGFTFGPDGNIYAGMFNCCGDQRVLRFNGTTGAFMDVFTSGAPHLDAAFAGLAFGPDGNLYASRFHGDRVERYNGTTGVFIDNFVKVGSGRLTTADYLTFGPDGNLYVTSVDSEPPSILEFDGVSGSFLKTFAHLQLPTGVVFAEIGVAFRGTATGIHNMHVKCRNVATGQSVDIVVNGQLHWSCNKAGFLANPGQHIVETITGDAD